MRKFFLSSLLLALSGVTLASAARASGPVRVSAGTWCPYVCQDEARPGALVELTRAAFAAVDIAVTFRILPWEREISTTRRAETDAMLAVAKGDVPDFVFPKRKIGRFRPCFFTGEGSSSGAVDFLYSDDYLPLSFKKIDAGRVDVMLDDMNVVRDLGLARISKPGQATQIYEKYGLADSDL
jgi:hypothetical protein